MIEGKLPKIILAMLISILWIAGGPSTILAGAAKSSLSLQGSSSLGRKIPGASLSPSLTRSPHPAPARPGNLASLSRDKTPVPSLVGKRYPANSIPPKTLITKVIPQEGRTDLLAPRSLRGPLAANLPRATSPSHKVSPPSKQSAPNKLTDRIVTQARHYLGAPYRSGGSLETGRATDCSGFVQFIYQKSNIDLPRSSSEQAQAGAVVTRTLDLAKLLPGDLLFFGPGGRRIGHVGIYLGDGKMIHASSSRHGVVISDLEQPSLEGSFVVAKRLPEVQSPQKGSSGNSSSSRSL